MAIPDTLKALRIDPLDARQVAGWIAATATEPNDRIALIHQWEQATTCPFPQTLLHQLTGLTPIGTWPRNPEAHRGNP